MKNSELLEKILERPPLYIGHASVTRMKLFIDGYGFARSDYGGEMKDSLYDGFQKWVANRFGFGHSHSWASIISFMGSSEARAFELTKELWEEYKAEMNTSIE